MHVWTGANAERQRLSGTAHTMEEGHSMEKEHSMEKGHSMEEGHSKENSAAEKVSPD